MKPRANWKGYLQVAALSCPVALYTAASNAERIILNTVNRATGHRVRREFIDSGTGETVAQEDQVKGYEFEKERYLTFEPEEIAATMAKSDKTLSVSAFIDLGQIDTAFFDKPYYLAPAETTGEEIFALFHEGIRRLNVVAIAQAVLFRRLRTVMIRPYEKGLVATTLHFDYEVRPATEVFANIPDLRLKGEMLELAEHIIRTKQGVFDPSEFEDRYESALAELVKAKVEGRTIAPPPRPERREVFDLMQALRDSAGARGKTARKTRAKPESAAPGKRARAPRRKAS